MSLLEELIKRANEQCELCGSNKDLLPYTVPPKTENSPENSLLLCQTCLGQITGSASMDPNHWRCLNASMWSEFPPVQVMSWRLLNQLRSEGWSQDLLDQMYLDEEVKAWATALEVEKENQGPLTKDSNGTILNDGDSVTLIKDLDVKGANFTAKRGTLVKNISLTSNPEHIEGKINGTQIVLVAKFLKKV